MNKQTLRTKIMNIKGILEKTLDEQFPKYKCKERGHALALYAMMVVELNKLVEEKWNLNHNRYL